MLSTAVGRAVTCQIVVSLLLKKINLLFVTVFFSEENHLERNQIKTRQQFDLYF